MAEGHPPAVPARRPIAQPIAGVAVAAMLFAGPLLLAAVPVDTADPGAQALPSPAAETVVEAADSSVLAARDEASASRGRARATPSPSVAPAPSATPAPSPAKPTVTAEPTPTPPPPPPPPPPLPPVVGEVWATDDVNVRSGPSADTGRIGYVAALDQVGVTGTTGDGWTQVVIDGRAGWINSSYLAETKPEPAPVPVAQPAAAPEPAAEAQPEAASESAGASCSINPGIEPNLTGNARAVYRAVCAAYGGSVSGFGGYRPGDGGDHGSGRAVDIMVSGPAGWEISRFLQERAGELGISYVIYEQQIWMAGSPAGAWEHMEDRGGATANHFDHVHVSVG